MKAAPMPAEATRMRNWSGGAKGWSAVSPTADPALGWDGGAVASGAIARPAAGRARYPWMKLAGVVLLAYAVMGKGAGYIGLPPIFVGEGLLLLGVAAIL